MALQYDLQVHAKVKFWKSTKTFSVYKNNLTESVIYIGRRFVRKKRQTMVALYKETRLAFQEEEKKKKSFERHILAWFDNAVAYDDVSKC